MNTADGLNVPRARWRLSLLPLLSLLVACAPGTASPTAAPPTVAKPAAVVTSPSPSPAVAASPVPSPAVVASPLASPVALRGEVVVTANRDDRTLSVADVGAARIVATVPLDRPPHRVALTQDVRFAFASDSSEGSRAVVVVDLTMLRQIGTLTVGARPLGIVISSLAGLGVVTNQGDDTVSLFDPIARTEAGTIRVGRSPHGLDVVTIGGVSKAFVANAGDGTVSVVDLRGRTVLATVQVGGRPTEVVAAPDGSRVFVLNEGTESVVVLDAGTHQQLTTIRLRAGLTGIDVSPDSRSLYVTASEPTRNLWRIDLATNQVADEFGLGDGALAVAAGRDPGRVFVTTANNRLLFWDPGANRASATLDVGRRPEDIALAVVGLAPSPSPVVPGGSPSPTIPSGSPAPAVATPSPTTAQAPAPTVSQPTPSPPGQATPSATVAPAPQGSPTP